MVSKSFPAIDSIDFHVNKLVFESNTAEPNNNFLFPFPYEEED